MIPAILWSQLFDDPQLFNDSQLFDDAQLFDDPQLLDDSKLFDDPQLFDDQFMDFDNPKVYRDTFISDGLVSKIVMALYAYMPWHKIHYEYLQCNHIIETQTVIKPAREAGGPKGPARWER